MIQALTQRKLASFSLVGHADVELGVLAATTPDLSLEVIRRAALNLGELIRGRGVEELPVALFVDSQLLINARTAAAIGYSPDLRTRSMARILHPEALIQGQQPLTLARTFELAEQGSASLAISQQDVESSLHTRQLARSPLLPQVNAVPSFLKRDVRGLEGILPDRTLTLGVTVSQMIYDDRIVTGFKAAQYRYEASQEALESEKLDVFLDSGTAFLRLGLAEILHRIERENLELTQENLDLARLRLQVGHSGRDEVFRWEAEVAQRRSELPLRPSPN